MSALLCWCSRSVTAAKFTKTDLKLNKALQHPHIPLFVAGLVHWGLGNKCGVSEALVIEQPPEWLYAHGSLANVFMPVELGSALGLGVVQCQTRTASNPIVMATWSIVSA